MAGLVEAIHPAALEVSLGRRTDTMTKQLEPQTVATAEAILRDLETKRDECL